MVIYGVSLLAICMLIASISVVLISCLLEIDANVEGVGISMLLLLSITNFSSTKYKRKSVTEAGYELDVTKVIKQSKLELASFKVPECVKLVKMLPRNIMGKVQKNYYVITINISLFSYCLQ